MRIPDGLTDKVLTEIKNVAYLGKTQQLRDFAKFASDGGMTFYLWVRSSTVLSAPLSKAIEEGSIILMKIP